MQGVLCKFAPDSWGPPPHWQCHVDNPSGFGCIRTFDVTVIEIREPNLGFGSTGTQVTHQCKFKVRSWILLKLKRTGDKGSPCLTPFSKVGANFVIELHIKCHIGQYSFNPRAPCVRGSSHFQALEEKLPVDFIISFSKCNFSTT